MLEKTEQNEFKKNLLVQNFHVDSKLQQLQKNLIKMGFDLGMINKVICYCNVKTEEEAIDYMIKNENDMWLHPFIPRQKNESGGNNDSFLIGNAGGTVGEALSKLKSSSAIFGKEKSFQHFDSGLDICEICGDPIAFHLNKEVPQSYYDFINMKNYDYVEDMEKNEKHIKLLSFQTTTSTLSTKITKITNFPSI